MQILRARLIHFAVAALANALGCDGSESPITGASEDADARRGQTDASSEHTLGERDLPREVSIPTGSADCSCQHDAPTMLASVDEAPAGIAARDLLALVALDGPQPIRWQAESEYDWEAPRAIVSGSGSLPDHISLEVAYQGGAIRFSGPTDCWRMDVQVAVSLRSGDGTLDAQVTGWLHGAGSDEWGFARDRTAWLDLMLHVPETSFRGTTSTAQDCMPLQGIGPLGGTLDVEATLQQRAPDDPVDGPWTLSQRGRMVVLPVNLRFDERGVHGSMDAWLYGASDGSLRRTEKIAVLGAP